MSGRRSLSCRRNFRHSDVVGYSECLAIRVAQLSIVCAPPRSRSDQIGLGTRGFSDTAPAEPLLVLFAAGLMNAVAGSIS